MGYTPESIYYERGTRVVPHTSGDIIIAEKLYGRDAKENRTQIGVVHTTFTDQEGYIVTGEGGTDIPVQFHGFELAITYIPFVYECEEYFRENPHQLGILREMFADLNNSRWQLDRLYIQDPIDRNTVPILALQNVSAYDPRQLIHMVYSNGYQVEDKGFIELPYSPREYPEIDGEICKDKYRLIHVVPVKRSY